MTTNPELQHPPSSALATIVDQIQRLRLQLQPHSVDDDYLVLLSRIDTEVLDLLNLLERIKLNFDEYPPNLAAAALQSADAALKVVRAAVLSRKPTIDALTRWQRELLNQWSALREISRDYTDLIKARERFASPQHNIKLEQDDGNSSVHVESGGIGDAALLESAVSGARSTIQTVQRDVSAGAALDLSLEYWRQALRHEKSWKRWLGALIGMAVVNLVAGGVIVLRNHPSGEATTAAAVSAFAFNIFVIGILLYGMRVAALQFRTHRHLEEIARNKAAALRTFRIMTTAGAIDGFDSSTILAILAQAVFVNHDSGLLDGADHITLIERLAAPVSQRLAK